MLRFVNHPPRNPEDVEFASDFLSAGYIGDLESEDDRGQQNMIILGRLVGSCIVANFEDPRDNLEAMFMTAGKLASNPGINGYDSKEYFLNGVFEGMFSELSVVPRDDIA